MGLHTQHQISISGSNLQLATVVLVAVASVFTADALRMFCTQMARRDFAAFYASGQAWNQHKSMYSAGRSDLPNLNPPGTVVLLFGPLARLPLALAGALWQALGGAALALASWRVARELALRRQETLLAVAVLLVTVPARHVWLEGQITWMLLVPATEAWIAYRRGALTLSGVWLGIVVAVKPFFGISALALGIPVAFATGTVCVLVTAVGVLLTSLEPWREWLALGPGVSVTWPASASIWTLGTRFVGAAPLDVVTWTNLPVLVTVAAIVVSATGLIASAATRHPDRRWIIAIALALLVSPLGWMYYLPLAFGALTSLWKSGCWRKMLSTGVTLSCVPMHVHFWGIRHGWLSGISIGAAYTWAVALILIASVSTDAQPDHFGRRSVASTLT